MAIFFTDVNTPDNWQILFDGGQIGMHQDCCCGPPCPTGKQYLQVSLSWPSPTPASIIALPNYHNDLNYTVSANNISGECDPAVQTEYITWLSEKFCNGQVIKICPTTYTCKTTYQTSYGSPCGTKCTEAFTLKTAGTPFKIVGVRDKRSGMMSTDNEGKRVILNYNGRTMDFAAIKFYSNWAITLGNSTNSLTSHSPTSVGQVTWQCACPVKMPQTGFITTTDLLTIAWLVGNTEGCG